ncbi:hypothetical protein [Roseateles asaccharophilus]|uniref:Uncharacterized protein n=1 Tax=Roseateles asaccharophilus TaxID=582607 RepID=A0ABU2A653_9BURK|nr:hypothetical protein [Roseateles asaccharophilus]MDR7332676.1 hypothetical protein [Roseateles asaccharophilus]
MNYKSVTEPFEGAIKSRPDTKYDFVDRDRHEKGYHFCIPFVPGDYEFFNLILHTYFGGGTDFGPRKHEAFSLPFSLKPGEAVHIGRLKAWLDTRSGLAPMPQFNSIALLTSEAPPALREAARAKCEPAVQSKPVRYAPLQASVANSPRVRHESVQ